VYTKIDGDDYVVSVNFFYSDNADIVIYNQSKALKLNIAEIPLFKRNAKGNISMGGTNKEVNGMSVLRHDSTEYLICTANGYINKITPDSLPSGRAKAGKSVTRLVKGDRIVAILGVNEASTVRVLATNGQHSDIAVNTIPMGSSVSVGYKANSGILGAWNM
jgi:DNA gyrase/topoisomerase IV subunit A